jgi:hypothetical protein
MPEAHDNVIITTFLRFLGLFHDYHSTDRFRFASIPRESKRCAVLYKFHSVLLAIRPKVVWDFCLLAEQRLDRIPQLSA